MRKIVYLDSENSQPFSQLVLPMNRGYFDKLGETGQLAVGVEDEGRPAGLLIAGAVPALANPGDVERARATDHWEIKQIYVPPESRKAGNGRELLRTLAALLCAQGVQQLSLTYALEEKRRKDVEAFLVRCGWPDPLTTAYQYRVTRSRVKSRWICPAGEEIRKYQLPAGVTITDFTTLTEREKTEVEEDPNLGYPAYLAPFDGYHLLYLENSLLLRVNGAITGWILAVKYGDHTVFYRGIFVKAEYRSAAYGLYLLAAAIRLQFAMGNENAMFAVNVKNPTMRRWIDWMLGGDYDYIWEIRTATKQLV